MKQQNVWDGQIGPTHTLKHIDRKHFKAPNKHCPSFLSSVFLQPPSMKLQDIYIHTVYTVYLCVYLLDCRRPSPPDGVFRNQENCLLRQISQRRGRWTRYPGKASSGGGGGVKEAAILSITTRCRYFFFNVSKYYTPNLRDSSSKSCILT